MLAQYRPTVCDTGPALGHNSVSAFSGIQVTDPSNTMMIQCWSTGCDTGPTLNHILTIICLLCRLYLAFLAAPCSRILHPGPCSLLGTPPGINSHFFRKACDPVFVGKSSRQITARTPLALPLTLVEGQFFPRGQFFRRRARSVGKDWVLGEQFGDIVF